VNPAVLILREEEAAIGELQARDPALAEAALQAIRYLLEVLDRNPIQASPRGEGRRTARPRTDAGMKR
jgi:hypothetical protein